MSIKELSLGALSLTFASSLCLAKDLKPTGFKAAYSLQIDTDEIKTVSACAAAGDVTVSDSRTETAVGERSDEDSPDRKSPISMAGDAIGWVKRGFEEVSHQASLQLALAGKPEVSLSLARIWIVEVTSFNAEYDGRVVVDVSVLPAGGGMACWSERMEGTAENYGRPGKEANYQETVNHALDRAFAKTLGSGEFLKALCSCGASGSSASSPAAARELSTRPRFVRLDRS